MTKTGKESGTLSKFLNDFESQLKDLREAQTTTLTTLANISTNTSKEVNEHLSSIETKQSDAEEINVGTEDKLNTLISILNSQIAVAAFIGRTLEAFI